MQKDKTSEICINPVYFLENSIYNPKWSGLNTYIHTLIDIALQVPEFKFETCSYLEIIKYYVIDYTLKAPHPEIFRRLIHLFKTKLVVAKKFCRLSTSFDK